MFWPPTNSPHDIDASASRRHHPFFCRNVGRGLSISIDILRLLDTRHRQYCLLSRTTTRSCPLYCKCAITVRFMWFLSCPIPASHTLHLPDSLPPMISGAGVPPACRRRWMSFVLVPCGWQSRWQHLRPSEPRGSDRVPARRQQQAGRQAVPSLTIFSRAHSWATPSPSFELPRFSPKYMRPEQTLHPNCLHPPILAPGGQSLAAIVTLPHPRDL